MIDIHLLRHNKLNKNKMLSTSSTGGKLSVNNRKKKKIGMLNLDLGEIIE